MNNAGRGPVIVAAPRPVVPNSVSVGGLVIVRQCIILMIVLGIMLLFVGIVMAAAAGNNIYYDYSEGRYRYSNPTRNGGISLLVIGAIVLFVGGGLAFKASQDSKTVQGMVIPPGQQVNLITNYQNGLVTPNPGMNVQPGNASGFGYNQVVRVVPPSQPHLMPGYSSPMIHGANPLPQNAGPVLSGEKSGVSGCTTDGNQVNATPPPPPYDYRQTY